MKVNSLIIASIFALSFFSCSKTETVITEEIGGIPGMGNAGGNVEISEAFVLPEGVELLSVTGMEPSSIDIQTSSAILKSGGCASGWYGAGKNIQTRHRFRNNTDKPKKCYIPACSVYKCEEEGNGAQSIQLGTNVQEVEVEIPAYSEKDCIVKLFCLNKDWLGSKPDMIYNCLGLLKSERMNEFANYLKPFPIGRENYCGSTIDDYDEAADMVQEMVWCITQGTQGLEEKKRKFSGKYSNWGFRR